MDTPHDLFCAYLDGRRLSDDERAAVSNWVHNDPHAAQRIVETTLVHEWLADRMSVLHLLEDLQTQKDPELREDVSAALDRFVQASEGRTAGRFAGDRAPSNAPTYRSAAVAAVLLIGITIAISLSSRRGPLPAATRGGESPVAASPAPVIAPRRVAPAVPAKKPLVATVHASVGGALLGGTHLIDGAEARVGDVLDLVSGVVEWKTVVGHSVVVEAPAAIEWVSPSKVRLTRGKLVGRAAGGVPLVVSTAMAEVIDLGTEFGVAHAGGETRVAVYDGLVELQPVSGRGGASRQIAKGFRDTADRQGLHPAGVAPLTHEREFIRPDELELRRLAAAGSSEAAEQVRWFELQRVEGLLGYQGFDAPSEAIALSRGFAPRPLELGPGTQWGANIDPTGGSSRSIQPAAGEPVLLMFDTSFSSPAAAANLIDAMGTIGRPGSDVWLSWSMRPARKETGDSYAGVALLFGPERVNSEPLFFGRPDGLGRLGLHPRDGQPITPLEFAEGQPGPGDPQRWIVHTRFDEPTSLVQAWCGVPAADLQSTKPQAEIRVRQLRFDRFSLGSGDGCVAWQFDDFVLAASREALGEALAIASAPVSAFEGKSSPPPKENAEP